MSTRDRLYSGVIQIYQVGAQGLASLHIGIIHLKTSAYPIKSIILVSPRGRAYYNRLYQNYANYLPTS
jgi:hypothetical protein